MTCSNAQVSYILKVLEMTDLTLEEFPQRQPSKRGVQRNSTKRVKKGN